MRTAILLILLMGFFIPLSEVSGEDHYFEIDGNGGVIENSDIEQYLNQPLKVFNASVVSLDGLTIKYHILFEDIVSINLTNFEISGTVFPSDGFMIRVADAKEVEISSFAVNGVTISITDSIDQFFRFEDVSEVRIVSNQFSKMTIWRSMNLFSFQNVSSSLIGNNAIEDINVIESQKFTIVSATVGNESFWNNNSIIGLTSIGSGNLFFAHMINHVEAVANTVENIDIQETFVGYWGFIISVAETAIANANIFKNISASFWGTFQILANNYVELKDNVLANMTGRNGAFFIGSSMQSSNSRCGVVVSNNSITSVFLSSFEGISVLVNTQCDIEISKNKIMDFQTSNAAILNIVSTHNRTVVAVEGNVVNGKAMDSSFEISADGSLIKNTFQIEGHASLQVRAYSSFVLHQNYFDFSQGTEAIGLVLFNDSSVSISNNVIITSGSGIKIIFGSSTAKLTIDGNNITGSALLVSISEQNPYLVCKNNRLNGTVIDSCFIGSIEFIGNYPVQAQMADTVKGILLLMGSTIVLAIPILWKGINRRRNMKNREVIEF